jgi:hypothetical protein
MGNVTRQAQMVGGFAHVVDMFTMRPTRSRRSPIPRDGSTSTRATRRAASRRCRPSWRRLSLQSTWRGASRGSRYEHREEFDVLILEPPLPRYVVSKVRVEHVLASGNIHSSKFQRPSGERPLSTGWWIALGMPCTSNHVRTGILSCSWSISPGRRRSV